jgi:hypothetical protein
VRAGTGPPQATARRDANTGQRTRVDRFIRAIQVSKCAVRASPVSVGGLTLRATVAASGFGWWKALEDENRRLKRVVADQVLNIQVLKDALGKAW